MRQTQRLVLLCCVLTFATAQAEEGRIPIFEPVEFDGATGDFSGRYVLTRDITVASGFDPVIRFNGTGTETVDLDLNGFRVTHDGTANSVIFADDLRSLTVRNGFVSAAGSGLFVIGGNCIVEQLIVEAGSAHGVWLNGPWTAVVRDNVVIAGGYAIFVESNAGRPVKSARIEDNMLTDVGHTGIFVLSYQDSPFKSVTIRGNTAKHDGSPPDIQDYGIRVTHVEGASVRENSIANFPRVGIDIFGSSGNAVTGNVVRECGDGISIRSTSGALVADNVVSDNTDDGIQFSQTATRNVVERNVMINNERYGLYFESGSDDNTFGRNTARGNGGGSCTFGTPICGTPDFCDGGTNINNTSFGDNLVPGPPTC
ncbi:MAG: right-handed parallel beta-helix repeat-containing protein [bacterium]|nr:right-handed parallel beta-helix repeat-containing protein [bacterium]